MASGSKADLARAGTMELTTKEGRAYLEKNLTEWKKPLLLESAAEDGQTSADTSEKAGKKSAKKTTFKVDQGQDDDDQPSAKKAKLAKSSTMDVTAQEGKQLLGGQTLGDTRQVTKSRENAQKKSKLKRASTMQKVVAEATAYGYGSSGGQRASRKRQTAETQPAKKKSAKIAVAKQAAVRKAGLKKAGTMVKTAKEGRQLIGDEKLGDTRQVTKQKQKKQN